MLFQNYVGRIDETHIDDSNIKNINKQRRPMKYSIGIITIVTLTALFVLSGCDNPSHKMEKAEISIIETNRDHELYNPNSEVESELRNYRAENADRIIVYNRNINMIKQKIENEPDRVVRERDEIRLERYEVTHRELKREMDNYKVSGRDSWDNFKDSFGSRMDDLGNSLDDFFSTTTTASSSN